MLKIFKSLRVWAIYIAPLVVIAWLFLTDPDRGASTRDMLQMFASAGLSVTAAHILRKTVFPYVRLERIIAKAKEGSTGAGLVTLGMCIVFAALMLVFAPRAHAQDVRTFVPAGAFKYAPMLKAEQIRIWPGHPAPAMLAALVEQESCVNLTNGRCWNPAARLKTDREEGAGFGQITRAYTAAGVVRFDALAEVKALDPSLAEWNWSNVYERPDLQLRALVVMNRHCAQQLGRMVSNPQQILDMCDAAYNGGYTGLQAERRACGQRTGCDPQRWFGHVERVCLKSKVKWKGYGASACDINRSHVQMVSIVRRPKYRQLMEGSS